ncbi:hydrogenase maturation protease [Granulicella pectinivorans]|uniref:Hydrogenase maturation protease n=1 Tax=Granulicella pectinivorans TaxID=474950 RepID=A0A1I6MRB2_9BACT|nr:hydrogenase maturation protease [Granulicella pectinivorans]SFS18174.1 hydrogenase maturation protease [Granulicella pectinivorans]
MTILDNNAIPSISIIGLGNVFLGDDGFGPLAVETFRCAYRCGPEVEVLDLGTPGLDLAPYLYDRELVVVVDAVHADLPSGTLSMFSEEDFVSQRAKLRITGHDPGLWESLAHLRLAGFAPTELIVLGVNPTSCRYAEGMSPEVLGSATEAAKTIAQLLVDHGIACDPREGSTPPQLWWMHVAPGEQTGVPWHA